MATRHCPDYDNDEAMANLGRLCVDTFLHVRFNGNQEACREQIGGLLYNHVLSDCPEVEAEEEPEEEEE